MTTEERIENLEKRVLVLENFFKLMVLDDWLEIESAKITFCEQLTDEMNVDARGAFKHNKEIVDFIKTWSKNVNTILDIGLD